MSKIKEVATWKLCLLAFWAMFLQDVVATVMVVQESHYVWQTAGLFDAAAFLLGLVCLKLALGPEDKFFTRRSLSIIASITAANYVGTAVGVEIAKVLH